MPSIFYLILILFIGLLGSAWSVIGMLKYSINPYGLEVGQWRADPESGSINSDPYQKVLTSISGSLPLNAKEAVTFTRTVDDNKEPLRLNCTYKLGSKIANARFWTLTMIDKNGILIKPNLKGTNALYSQNLIFNADNSFSLTISSTPHSGNWLPTTGDGEFQLVLRMYDTSIISNSALFEINLPEIQKIGCDA